MTFLLGDVLALLGFRMFLKERPRYESLISGAREQLRTDSDAERRAAPGRG